MKLSEYINRLEEIKETDGDMDVAYYMPQIDRYVPLSSRNMDVESVGQIKLGKTSVSKTIETDLALFIG